MIKEPGSRVKASDYIEDSIPYIGVVVFEIVKGRVYVFLSSDIPERKIVYFSYSQTDKF